MKPLKVAILWHQHQPYYKMKGKFMLPWTRLHGVKDYNDLPELLHEYPHIRQTINLAPSLMIQIEDYIDGVCEDRIQELTMLDPNELSTEQKYEILRLFLLSNEENMIKPNPRFWELALKAQNKDKAAQNFNYQDWMDLQVWYNLSWIGPISKYRSSVQRLLKKQRNFTIEDKKLIMNIHNEILRDIIPTMKTLKELNQIEVSVSPMYHPILPLLINSAAALDNMPGLPMPDPIFSFAKDAEEQIELGMNYYKKLFGDFPIGFWPSEGSLSDQVLEMFAARGVKWVATDELMLERAIGAEYFPTRKYFPHKYASHTGEISILFRDHFLSDRIGFEYSLWNPQDAANDFMFHLYRIRDEILAAHGEEGLDNACIPVILDGENCWEFYPENGINFLRRLYDRLTDANEFITVTCSEAVMQPCNEYMPALKNIKAGSWINANFSIWIGHEEDRKGWSMLADARTAFENKKEELSDEIRAKIKELLFIAEGSDWFWWFGDEHHAENRHDFDTMFRWLLEECYYLMDMEAPAELFEPIMATDDVVMKAQTGDVKPSIDGIENSEMEWLNAGRFEARRAMGSMHQVGEILNRLYYARDKDNFYFRCDPLRQLEDDEFIELEFLNPKQFKVSMKPHGIQLHLGDNNEVTDFTVGLGEIFEFSFHRYSIHQPEENPNIEVIIQTKSKDGEVRYPRQGVLVLQFQDAMYRASWI